MKQALFQRLIAVKGQVFIDIFRRDQAAVAQRDTRLVLIKGHLVKRKIHSRLRLLVMMQQALDHAALQKVLGDDLLNIAGGDTGIKSALRVDDHDRAGLAQAEAAGADGLDLFIKAVLDQLFFQQLQQRFAAR